MSLQVWLPLTKDLRQQGLSNITITNSGATYSATGGKLGGCYVFDGSDDSIGIGNLSTLVNTDFTFACWFYHDDTWSSKNYETIFGGPSGFELETKNGSTQSPVIRAYSWGGSTFTYELNKWNHLVMTRTTSETKFYLNGELKLIGTAGTIPSGNYFIGSWSSTTGQNFKGKVNDVRIYDHCLSQMEVKELAKGLVLHYPLNRQGWGQENLILESHKVTGGGNASGITRTYESDGSMKIVSASGNGNWCSLSFAKDSNTNVGNNMAVGNTYCISCDVKITNGTTLPTLFINSGNGYKQLRPVSGSIITNKWIRVYYNSTWANPGTDYGNISLHLGFSGVVGTYYFKNFKLEKGTIPTPWCPNIADSNNMGLNSTIEYDHSGFGNNGTRTGAFTWTGDTPKYNISTVFNGSSCIDTNINYLGNEWSYGGWIYSATSSRSWEGVLMLNGTNPADADLQFGFYTCPKSNIIQNSANGKYNSSISWTYGVWHHFIGTYDGATLKTYIDGVLVNSTGITQAFLERHNFVIGARHSSGTNHDCYFLGNISDVRIYATALSADDVKSLYQNEAYIDSSGTIYGQIR